MLQGRAGGAHQNHRPGLGDPPEADARGARRAPVLEIAVLRHGTERTPRVRACGEERDAGYGRSRVRLDGTWRAREPGSAGLGTPRGRPLAERAYATSNETHRLPSWPWRTVKEPPGGVFTAQTLNDSQKSVRPCPVPVPLRALFSSLSATGPTNPWGASFQARDQWSPDRGHHGRGTPGRGASLPVALGVTPPPVIPLLQVQSPRCFRHSPRVQARAASCPGPPPPHSPLGASSWLTLADRCAHDDLRTCPSLMYPLTIPRMSDIDGRSSGLVLRIRETAGKGRAGDRPPGRAGDRPRGRPPAPPLPRRPKLCPLRAPWSVGRCSSPPSPSCPPPRRP